MSGTEVCPGCSTSFDARKALVSRGVPPFFNMYTVKGISFLVRCPNCWRQFRSQKIRFFGFLTPNGVGWVALALLAICVIAAALIN